jgi:hypothetical protein
VNLSGTDKMLHGPCVDAEDLAACVKMFCGLDVPRKRVCPDHDAPFDYLWAAYHDEADLVVWAPRGGAKTRLGAVATLLDLLHKPGVAVRILGGSLEQSLRMWEYLVPDLAGRARGKLASQPRETVRKLSLLNGSTAAALAQSQRAVRGLRVQRLRCDEVEMFDPAVWNAAQLVTRSSGGVRASIEALSTLHLPYGLMARVVDDAQRAGTRVLKWCLLEVLEKCPRLRDLPAVGRLRRAAEEQGRRVRLHRRRDRACATTSRRWCAACSGRRRRRPLPETVESDDRVLHPPASGCGYSGSGGAAFSPVRPPPGPARPTKDG